MTDPIAALERRNRQLSYALIAALAFGLGALWGGGRSERPGPLLLPRAEAGGGLETYQKESERPAYLFVPSDSGATLYEYQRQPDGTYLKRAWG